MNSDGEERRDELRTQLLELTQAHYAEDGTPFWLAKVGDRIRKSGHGHLLEGIKLSSFVGNECPSLSLVVDPQRPERVAVALPDNREAIQVQVLPEEPRVVEQLRQYPRSLLIAFCVEVEPTEKIVFRTSPPHRYAILKAGQEPKEGFAEIPAEVRLPGLRVNKLEQIDKAEQESLLANISDWLAKVDWTPEPQTQSETHSARGASPGRLGRHALARLIEAQPAAIRKSMVIPVDIIEMLLRRG